jgi:hopene-associated glycosyltransferase HpnB
VYLLITTIIALLIWIYLICFRGKFWLSDLQLDSVDDRLENYPPICAVIPARNEAEVLPTTLRSLLESDYPGNFSLVLVDDQSSDRTEEIALEIAAKLEKDRQLTIITGQPLPSGWTGKLWALEQGIARAKQQTILPKYILLTDADIQHDRENLKQLVIKAEIEQLDLVSLMVMLRCESFWEKFLIPAFIFFFAKLYPFAWVNNPDKKTAAAAGGCILISTEALEKIGGIQILREALIDDCTLAQKVKEQNKKIWLGLTKKNYSLRAYASLKSIWQTIARTAFTQLNYSPLLLIGTVLGMILVYLVPPLAAIAGIIKGNWLLAIVGGTTWLLMAISYLPTILFYQLSPLWTLSLPAIAGFYNMMTIDSALLHWQGKGGAWKGRIY